MGPIRKNSASFIETDVDDETIIVSLDSGVLFSLKDTGLSVWKLIDGKRDRDEIIELLAEEYGLASKSIEPEIDEFLQSIQQTGLTQ